jgi:DNA polymerase III subunit delta
VPELKPAYLIHGDDHGAVAERRAGLRMLVERQEGGSASVELLEGDAATPAGVADALAAMTLALGQRVIMVEGVERWRQADVEKQLAAAIKQMPPDTTLAMFAREEARAKAPAALHDAVKRAGGQIVAQMTVKPWELAKWTREQADRLGISLDAAAAKALVAQVGERQQRLLRELEKLALEGDPADMAADPSNTTAGTPERGATATPRQIGVHDIEQRAAHSTEWRAYGLADALVGGNRSEATLSYLRLRQQGERLSGLTYLMAQRLRDALAIALRLQAGESVAEIKRGLRMPARAAERFVADVARSDVERLRAALAALADLELDTRGGAPLQGSRTALAGLGEDTLALRAIEAITQQAV